MNLSLFRSRTASPQRPVLRVPLRYIDDHVLVTDKAVWTYVVLADARSGMQTSSEVVGYVAASSRPLARLASGQRPVSCHLRIMHIPESIEQWRAGALARAPYATAGWEKTVDLLAERWGDHPHKQVILGVEIMRVGQEETFFNSGPFKLIKTARHGIEQAAGVDGEIVTPEQLAQWHARARQVHTQLAPIGRPATEDEVKGHILQVTNPGIPLPRITGASRTFGPGLERVMLNDPITVHNRMINYLDLDDQPFMHSAYVPVSRTSDEIDVADSDPWLYSCSQVGFPVDWSCRFEVVPNQVVRKDLQRGGAHAKDMASHMNEAGKEIPIALDETVSRLTELEYETSKSRLPGLYGQYVAHVWAETPELLAQRVQTLRESMEEHDMSGEWSSGDQHEFALSSILGADGSYRPYNQQTNLYFLFAGAPTWSDAVGDRVDPATGQGWKGGRIGETIGGTPVDFTPHVAPARNRAPGFVFVGQAGSGKSFGFGKVAWMMSERGVTTDLIDPKPDIIDPRGERFRLPDLIKYTTGREVQVVDVVASPPGSLDPFRIAESREAGIMLAESALGSLLNVSSEASQAALATALNREAEEDRPSTSGVLRRLRELGSSDLAARALAERLDMMTKMQFARLLIGEPDNAFSFRRERGLFTAITTRGLRLPSGTKPFEQYDSQDKIGALILSLLVRQCAYSLTTDLDRTYPKALLVDEAHILTATDAGKAMTGDAMSMLRSRNGVVGLASQTLRGMTGAADESEDRVMANVSSIFAFRQEKPAEAKRVLDELKPGVVESGGLAITELQKLPTGQCIMKDIDRRYEHIVWDRTIDSERMALETNPDELDQITPGHVNEALAYEFGVGPWTPGEGALMTPSPEQAQT